MQLNLDINKRKIINYLLLPLAVIFYILSFVRRKLYQFRILKSYKSIKPVIVVGNITVGGTGKTPIVIEIVKFLQGKNLNVGVVSRGYGRKNSDLVIIDNNTKVDDCGDEPLLIFAKTKCSVAVAKNRVSAIKALENQVDIIISDDGLQHYKMQRDIEIVVFNGLSNGFYLPAGGLREGKWRLKSVDFIIKNQDKVIENIAFINAKTAEKKPLDYFKNQKVLAICGIANPDRFFDNLQNLGVIITKKSFPDHYNFTKNDLKSDELIITTAKDWVKYKNFATKNMWYLDIKVKIDADFYQNLMLKL